MCGIIGSFGNEKIKAFDVLSDKNIYIHRGSDNFGVVIDDKIYHFKKLDELLENMKSEFSGEDFVFHNLHSVVSYVPQPFYDDGFWFAANCEIYNWKELSLKYGIQSRNDSEFLYLFLKKFKLDKLDEVDGDFAFIFREGKNVYLVRDVFGVNPLFYSLDSGLFFASESKILDKFGFGCVELNPRKILVYDIESKKSRFIERDFFKVLKNADSKSEIIKKLEGLVVGAVSKRVPDQEFGILFSGGIDSSTLALVCKNLGLDPILYTASFQDGNLRESPDAEWAEKVGKRLGFRLRHKVVSLEELERDISRVAYLIESRDVVKVGVALPFYYCTMLAREDKVKVIFSGLGSEEIFAGYQRHLDVLNSNGDVNMECLNGLLGLYQRDLYRDNVICMSNNVELRLPFLDRDLVSYGLSVPAKYKLDLNQKKIILREVAVKLGLDLEFAMRKKLGAQYGSNFDKAILKLAKKNGFAYRRDYLNSL